MFKLVLIMSLVSYLMLLFACTRTTYEIDFASERIAIQIPNNTNRHIRNISGVRVLAEGALRVDTYYGFIYLLDILNDSAGFALNAEHRDILREKYAEYFFQSQRLILLGFTLGSSGGNVDVINIMSNRVINVEKNLPEGGFQVITDWTFAISVQRDFNPRTISVNIVTN